MLIKQIIDVYDLLDDSRVDGRTVVDYLRTIDPEVNAETYPLTGPRGTTHMLKVRIPGSDGKSSGGNTPTLGILGRLGWAGSQTRNDWVRVRWRWCACGARHCRKAS